MKSKLNSYRKVAHLSVKRVLRQMHLSEEELYQLMKTWVAQGIFSANHPHFVELKKSRKKRISQHKHEVNEALFADYQYLKREGRDNSEIAEILERGEEKINKFCTRWYRQLRMQGLSGEAIRAETGMSAEEIAALEAAYAEKLRRSVLARKRQKKSNAAYSDRYLDKLKKELKDPGAYLIFDLEGVQNPDEILEIAVIDFHGNILMNTLVRPSHKIGWHISHLTGISDEMAAQGAPLETVMQELREISAGKTMLSWGTDYDRLLLKNAVETTGVELDCAFACAQHIHMGVIGSSAQIALGKACGSEEQSHRALDDCRMVLDVLRRDITEQGI